MIQKKIKYIDYDGNQREEVFYFNLTKTELTEMQVSSTGGFIKKIEKIIESQDSKSIMEIFKDLILRSYGEKSPDGKRFIKNQELRDAFMQTEAYSELFMELGTDDVAASDFIDGIMPANLTQDHLSKDLKQKDKPDPEAK